MVTWPEVFIRSGFTIEQVAKQDYLTGAPGADGHFFCKACSALVTGSREKHFKQHVREISVWSKAREAKIKQERLERLHQNAAAKPKVEKSEFYDHKCACGAPIKRTGKRGQPPKKCEACRTGVSSTVTPTCAGVKADGSKCGMKKLVGSNFCRWHQDSK